MVLEGRTAMNQVRNLLFNTCNENLVCSYTHSDPFVGSTLFYIVNGVGSVIILSVVSAVVVGCYCNRRRRYKH